MWKMSRVFSVQQGIDRKHISALGLDRYPLRLIERDLVACCRFRSKPITHSN